MKKKKLKLMEVRLEKAKVELPRILMRIINITRQDVEPITHEFLVRLQK